MKSLEETEYLLLNTPTIADVRELNRDGYYAFALPMLMALIDAGVDIEKESQAAIAMFPHETPDLIEMRYAVRLNGKLIALLGDGRDDEFRVIAKRRPE